MCFPSIFDPVLFNSSLLHLGCSPLPWNNSQTNRLSFPVFVVLNKIANLFDHLLLSSLSPRLKTHRPFVIVFPLGITFSEVTLSFLFSLEVKSLIFSSPISVSLCDILFLSLISSEFHIFDRCGGGYNTVVFVVIFPMSSAVVTMVVVK